MPIKNFRCPDGVTIGVEDCLSKCRMEIRCASPPTLLSIVKGDRDRAWDGIPHVTELMGGTMEAYLKHTVGYTTSPDAHAPLLLGTAHHAMLEEMAIEMGNPAEVSLQLIERPQTTATKVRIMQGSPDYLDQVEDSPSIYDLWDYKAYGMYLADKVLGNKTLPDRKDLEMQLNAYRVMLEDMGINIGRMWVQVTIKSDSWMIKRSIPSGRAIHVIEIDHLDDDYIREYYGIKSKLLRIAHDTGKMPSVCSPEERWFDPKRGDAKCKNFCDVAEFCPHGIGVNLGK